VTGGNTIFVYNRDYTHTHTHTTVLWLWTKVEKKENKQK